MRGSLTALSAACCLTVAICGCVADEEVYLVVHRGELNVDWTIQGAREPGRCAAREGRTFELVVRNDDGLAVVTAEVACDEFAIGLELAPGDYVADATLLDGSGSPVSETIVLRDVHIESDVLVELAIDFAEIR